MKARPVALAEGQRTRLLEAMVGVVCERGYAGVSVSAVCGRARVSRLRFYELFDVGLQGCFLAVIDEGHRQAHMLISNAFEGQGRWEDGVRAALASLLAFLDEHPLLARVWFIEVLTAGGWALERRERHVTVLTKMIVERWPFAGTAQPSPLAASGVMESLLGIIHTHLLTRSDEPLVGLLGPLMGLIAAVYLDGQAAAQEIECGAALTRAILAERQTQPEEVAVAVRVPGALLDPRAHRARECLHYLARHPQASNQQVASAVGIARKEQISRLLARLDALGLLAKRAARPGARNAWSLTPYGEQVARALQVEHASASPHATCQQARSGGLP